MAPYTAGQTGGKVLAPTYKRVRTKCAHSYAIYIYMTPYIYKYDSELQLWSEL